MDHEPTSSQIIDRLGGTACVARMFTIKPPSVSGWRVKGIPAARLMYLRLAHPDVFGTEQIQGISTTGVPDHA